MADSTEWPVLFLTVSLYIYLPNAYNGDLMVTITDIKVIDRSLSMRNLLI